jgi:ABC-2 type transport system ATP-binding protein
MNLKKGFLNKKVLNGIDLEIKKGNIYGLVGPNGSGKSTLMKIIVGLMQKKSGEIYLNGDLLNTKNKHKIAYEPTEDYFFQWMKVKDALDFYTKFYINFNFEKALTLIKKMDLDIEQKISSLSTGQKGRLKLVLTLSRELNLYMLDEPLNGIDPISRDKIIDLISSEIDGDKTIIIASHLIKEFETILDEVIFLKDGKILFEKNCEELRIENNMSIHDYYKTIYN